MMGIVGRTFILGFIFLCLSVSAPQADAKSDKFAQESSKIIESLAQEVTTFLSKPDYTDEELHAKFNKLLRANFDLTRIARFSLGSYWNEATPAQQKEYQKLFEDFIIHTYANRFKSYSGEEFVIDKVEAQGRYAFVCSLINDPKSGQRVIVDWRLRQADKGKPRIVDVVVEGVSLSLTQREEFAAVIQREGGNIDALLDALKARRITISQQ